MGLVAFSELAPIVLASFFGGAVVDRVGHQLASILADLVSAVSVGLVPLLYVMDNLAFWELLVLVAISSFFGAPGSTARAALIPDLAGLAAMSLERSTSAVQAVDRGARLLGAPLAGFLIALFGPTVPLWIDAATFLVSALLVTLFIRGAGVAPESDLAAAPGRYLDDLRAGLRYVRNRRLLRAIVLSVMVTNFLDSAFTVLRPVYAQRVYGSALSLGFMTGALGGGALAGALLYAAFGERLPRRPVYIGCFMLVAVSYWVFAFLPPLPAVLIALVAGGFAAGPINPIVSTAIYERVPTGMRARVLGLVVALAWMAMPLAVMVSGLAIDRIGLRPFIVIVSSLYVMVVLSVVAVPAFRDLEKVAERPPDRSVTEPA